VLTAFVLVDADSASIAEVGRASRPQVAVHRDQLVS